MTTSPWARLDVLKNVPTRGPAERAVILAAVRWADADGVLWPSVASWARLAGVGRRTLQTILRRLVDRGVLAVVADSRGGAGRTIRYRIVALSNGAAHAPMNGAAHAPMNGAADDLQQRSPRRKTAQPTASNGAPAAPELQGTVRKQPPTTSAAAVGEGVHPSHGEGAKPRPDVFARLGIGHLRDHPNATPARVAWIEREAPTKDSPGGWAAAAIRDGFAVPPPTPEETKAAARAQRAAILARFDAMPEADRTAIEAKARRLYPNLADARRWPVTDGAVRGAIAAVLGKAEGHGGAA